MRQGLKAASCDSEKNEARDLNESLILDPNQAYDTLCECTKQHLAMRLPQCCRENTCGVFKAVKYKITLERGQREILHSAQRISCL